MNLKTAKIWRTASDALLGKPELSGAEVAEPQELTALNSVAAVVSRSLDLDRILPDALAKTIEVMDMAGGAIFRLSQDTNSLLLFAHQGVGDELVNLSKVLSLESSIVNQVVKTRQPTAQSVSEYPPGELRTALERAGWIMVVSIPLVAQEQVLGAINVVSRTLGKPTPEELAVPAAIGQQIGVAIDNSRLYAQSVEYAHQMELARQTADAANASKSNFLANVSHELRTPLVTASRTSAGARGR